MEICVPISTLTDVENFADFLKKQPHKHKVIIAGNHDWPFENEGRKRRSRKYIKDSGSIYLNDSGITLEGLNFWGHLCSPDFMTGLLIEIEEKI